MKISDLFIGKPGGLTTAEALACSLPMIIVDPIPGQEERNSDHLLEKGCALKSNELTTLAWKIDQLLDEPGAARIPCGATPESWAAPTRRGPSSIRSSTITLPPLRLDADQREAIAQAATGEVPVSKEHVPPARQSCPAISSGESRPPPTRARGATTAPASRGPIGRARRKRAGWRRSGRRRNSGRGTRRTLRRVRGLGLNAFRLGIEWSRIQPCYNEGKAAPPAFDMQALEHYARMLRACREAGDGAGADAAPLHASRVARHRPVARSRRRRSCSRNMWHRASAISMTASSATGHAPVRVIITINEPNMLVFNSYLGMQFPCKAQPGLPSINGAVNGLLQAHVRAYNCLHDLYGTRGWEAPAVTFNNYCSDLYWLDKFFLDLLAAGGARHPARRTSRIISAAAASDSTSLFARRTSRCRRICRIIAGTLSSDEQRARGRNGSARRVSRRCWMRSMGRRAAG